MHDPRHRVYRQYSIIEVGHTDTMESSSFEPKCSDGAIAHSKASEEESTGQGRSRTGGRRLRSMTAA
ncbi:unnamed protein product [Protopolystoma xenopodis]|uniref:Uncharacterized protein n=1 Tax=Protopolystoma xenopodis TaxID=117903 RepID=A0A3S5CBL9_9PLAT|nr:unnamed protein product [Protopolystoma xenopodis]